MYKDRILKISRVFRKSKIMALGLCSIIGVMLILPGCSQRKAESDVAVINSTVSQTNESITLPTQVNEDDADTGAAEADTREEDMKKETTQEIKLGIRVGEELMTATLEENSSAEALTRELEKGDIKIDMHDFSSFEKVGPLGVTLPTNDKQITTGPGDVILYQGNQFVIYYDTNSWNFTQLAKIDDLTQDDLKRILGDGDVSVTLTLIRE